MGLVLAAILVAVLVGFWGPLRGVRSVLGVGHLISTGHAFLVLGAILGLLVGGGDGAVRESLVPIVAFVAGWVGFATGMRFEVRLLRTIPGRAFVVALLPAVGAALVVGLLSVVALGYAGVPVVERVAGSLALAATAASSGPSLAALVRGRRAGRASSARSVLRMIELSAGVDDLLVVTLAMLAFPMLRGAALPALSLVGASVAGGALLGGVVWLFLGGAATDDERLLLGLAMLAFIGGFAEWLSVSPAAVGAVSAMVLVNLPGERMAKLLSAVRRVERPAVVILMTLIGFHVIGQQTWLFVPLFVALTLVRVLAKGWVGTRVQGAIPGAPGLRATGEWALGLAPMGTLGVVVGFDFFQAWHHDFGRTLLAAVAAASLVNEIAAPWLMVRLLRGAALEPRRAA